MYEFCGRCFGLEVGSLFLNVRFVAGVLGSMWRRSAKMYDLLPVFWARNEVPVLRCMTFVAGALGSKWGRCS